MSLKPKFLIDEEGTIRLLKRDIYNRRDVFIRELIQNAFDSNATSVSLILLSENEKDIWGLFCQDDGTGMSNSDIQNYFLCLCRRRPDDGTPRYARFGIGIFTYLAFAEEIQMATKKKRSKGWFISIRVPEEVVSFSNISLSKLTHLPQCARGTGVLLKLRTPLTIDYLKRSIDWYVRYDLPSDFSVRSIKCYKTDLKDYSKFINKITRGEELFSLKKRSSVPFGAYAITASGKIKGGYLSLKPGNSDGVVLCEDGILIDESCQNLIPPKFSNLGIQGLINLERGWLDIDAARSKILESERYDEVRQFIASIIFMTLDQFFARTKIAVDREWNADALILNKVLSQISHHQGAAMLYNAQDKIMLDLFLSLSYTCRMTLSQIARGSREIGKVFYVDGIDWGWRKSIGSIKGYGLELFVGKSDYARVARSKGAMIIVMPKNAEKGPLIPEAVLARYFNDNYGIQLLEITDANEGRPIQSNMPVTWKNQFVVPSNLKTANLPDGVELFFDSNLNAVVDIKKGVLREIDQTLGNNTFLTNMLKLAIETYLCLLSAQIDTGIKKLEDLIKLSLSKMNGHVSFASLIGDIKNGR